MIRFKTVLHNIGKVILIVALAILLPLIWSLATDGPDKVPFIATFLIMAGLGSLLTFAIRPEGTIRTREGYLIVTSCWLVIVLLGALPYVFAGVFPDYTSAFFETMSGFTTTGASALTDVEAISQELLIWRSMTQWLGGLGVIVLFVALLARIDTGGTIMFRAELAGPFTERISPHIDDSAKILWFIYLILTLVLIGLLCLCKMPFFDALCHAFSTMSTGGFSTRNAGLGAFDSDAVHWVLAIFLFIAGTSFALLYRVFVKRATHLWNNEEFRLYASIVIIVTLAVFVDLKFRGNGDVKLVDALLQVIDQLTTTGFTYLDTDSWPPFSQVVIINLMMIGACYSSTSGSLKTGMYLLLFKNVRRVLFGMLHPQALTEVKINGKVVNESVINKALQYFAMFMVSMVIGAILLSMTGLPLREAMTGAMSAISNTGPAAGMMGPTGNYADVTILGKWVLSTLMLIGRLEFYTVVIVFLPSFWKQ